MSKEKKYQNFIYYWDINHLMPFFVKIKWEIWFWFENSYRFLILQVFIITEMTMSMRKVGFLYLGRLEKEKGFDLILNMVEKYEKELPFELYVFGKGSRETSLLELQKKYKQIHFFWRKPLSEVARYLENIDYCLMPSLCVETFGLSAVNVLDWGIPVVGFKKWGLMPFIREEYDIARCEGQSLQEKFETQIENLIKEYKNQTPDFFSHLSQECKQIAQRYSKDRRFENFQQMSFDFKCKKILLVSDFINPIWGIETYLHEVKTLLMSKGYQVKLFGSHCPSGFWGRVKKYLWLSLSLVNIFEAYRFKKFVEAENPDLIWFHSVLRREWRMPISALEHIKVPKRMMYHDLGYFHPYPSKVQNPEEVKDLSFTSFIKMAKTKNPFKLVFVAGKWLSLRLLKKTFNTHIDKHLVPSSFMVPLVKRAIGVSTDKIQTLEHFIQK